MLTFITRRPRIPKRKKVRFVLTHSTIIGKKTVKITKKTQPRVQKDSTVIYIYHKR